MKIRFSSLNPGSPSRKASGGRPVGPQKVGGWGVGVGGWERPVASAKKYFYTIIIENPEN